MLKYFNLKSGELEDFKAIPSEEYSGLGMSLSYMKANRNFMNTTGQTKAWKVNIFHSTYTQGSFYRIS